MIDHGKITYAEKEESPSEVSVGRPSILQPLANANIRERSLVLRQYSPSSESAVAQEASDSHLGRQALNSCNDVLEEL